MMKIRVPATSANLGAGYDTMGMSLSLSNEFIFSPSQENFDNSNLIYKSFKYLFDKEKKECPKVKIEVSENVPIARGLGSSATCIVGGLMGANVLLGDKYSKKEILSFATEIEGHPDNVAPAIYGGLVISTKVDDEVLFYKVEPSENLSYIVIVPDYPLKTELARSLVKTEVKLEDAIYNISHSNLISRAIEKGDIDMLCKIYGDRLHEPYRKKLIVDFDKYKEIADRRNSAIFISGAGPTILIISSKDNKDICRDLKNVCPSTYKILELGAGEGVKIIGKDF